MSLSLNEFSMKVKPKIFDPKIFSRNFRSKNFQSKFSGYCSIRPRFFPYDFHTCFVTGFSQIGGVHFESKYEEMVRTFRFKDF